MIFKSFRRRVYIHIFQQFVGRDIHKVAILTSISCLSFVGFARFSYMKDLKSQIRKSQVRSLKEKLEREEQKVNCKIEKSVLGADNKLTSILFKFPI